MLSAFSFVDFYGNGDPFTNRLNALTFFRTVPCGSSNYINPPSVGLHPPDGTFI